MKLIFFKRDSLDSLDIPIPTIDEQRKIVQKIVDKKEELSLDHIKEEIDIFISGLYQ